MLIPKVNFLPYIAGIIFDGTMNFSASPTFKKRAPSAI